MARARAMSELCPQFEAFLYAAIDEDRDDVPLSVLSALARVDVDPWAEAERLAALPKCNAARRLAALLASLPDASITHRDSYALAARLVELLPSHGSIRHVELPEGLLSAKTTGLRISFLTGVLLGMQWFVTSCQPQNMVGSSPPAATTSSPATFDGINQ
jgi:hypothetical protein